MEDFIIILIIAVIVILGFRSALKHFQGKGGCCGASDYKPKRKRLKKVLYKKTFTVEGMSCKRCKNKVQEVLNDIPNISAKVSLKNKKVTVSYGEKVDDRIIKEKITRAGYTVK